MMAMGQWRSEREPINVPLYLKPDYATVPRDYAKQHPYYGRAPDETAPYNGVYSGYRGDGRLYSFPMEGKGLPFSPPSHLLPYRAIEDKTGKYYMSYGYSPVGMYDGQKSYETLSAIEIPHGSPASGAVHVSRVPPGQTGLHLGGLVPGGIGLPPAASSAMGSVHGTYPGAPLHDVQMRPSFVSGVSAS